MILEARAIASDAEEKPVLETVRVLLESDNLEVQGAASELLCSLCYCDAARTQVYMFLMYESCLLYMNLIQESCLLYMNHVSNI